MIRFGLLVTAFALLRPEIAEACSCLGNVPSSIATQDAEIVFVGTVARIDRTPPISHSRQNPDGSVTVTVEYVSAALVIFDVAHVFKGPSSPQIAVRQDGSSCDLPFNEGETWLIYGRDEIGGVAAGKCLRTRLASEAEQDLLYLGNREAGLPQGIVYGDVSRRLNGPGGLRNSALFEALQVTAVSATHRFVTTTDRWGPFELVLPPGDYEMWVERAGTSVSARFAVHVVQGADVRLQLIAQYSDPEK